MGGAPGDGRCRTSAVTDDRHCPRRRIAVGGTQAAWWMQQANRTMHQFSLLVSQQNGVDPLELVNDRHWAVACAPSALTQSRRVVGRGFRPIRPEEPAPIELPNRSDAPPATIGRVRRGRTAGTRTATHVSDHSTRSAGHPAGHRACRRRDRRSAEPGAPSLASSRTIGARRHRRGATQNRTGELRTLPGVWRRPDRDSARCPADGRPVWIVPTCAGDALSPTGSVLATAGHG